MSSHINVHTGAWKNAEKDLVILHQFPRARTCPNFSPYPIKVETYLRLSDIKYENDFKNWFSKLGKSPWITINGKDVTDSQLIFEYLDKLFKKDINGHLTAGEKAVERAMRVMIEERYYWCMAVERNIHSKQKFMPTFMPPLSKAPTSIVNRILRKSINKQSKAQGIGRHNQENVERFGLGDLEAVSELLGDKDYMFGDQPCALDVTVFSFTCLVLYTNPEDSVYLKAMNKKLKNLKAHNDRMKEKYWPDWEDCKYK